MTRFETKALDADTWPDFARLVEANNGVWDGCWCMWYHGKDSGVEDSPAARRMAKECRVRQGRAHAALVYAGTGCVGWCQFGSRRSCRASTTSVPTSRAIRRCPTGGSPVSSPARDIAATASRLPEDIAGRKASPAFLFNGALSTFERLGFKRSRLIGKYKWVVTRTVR
jgi:hypothetical protein